MNGKGLSMEKVHVNLTPFTRVPATSKIDLINEKCEGYTSLNRFGASNIGAVASMRQDEAVASY